MNSEKKNTNKKIVRAKWLVGLLLALLLIAAALPSSVVAAPPAAYDTPKDGIVTPSEGQPSDCGCGASGSTGDMESNLLDTGGSLSYTYGDIPLDEATYQKYLKRLAPTSTLDALDALPTAYDARNDGIVTPSKNQASCGGCWAFAAAGAMESHLLDAGMSFNPTDLSEQQQLSCNSGMSGCCGGSMDSLHYWETLGPVYETCFPWGDGGTSCPTNSVVPCSPGDSCPQLPYRVINFYTVASDQFRQSLDTDGPSYWRFDVYTDFQDWYWNAGTPAGDVYVNADTAAGNNKEGGHAVLIIGWDDAKGAYLMKNSWGNNTGPQGDGTFWIAYSGHHNDLGFAMANFDVQALDVNMSIAKSDSPDPVIAGEQLTYYITVANIGPNSATNVVVTDVLPSAVTYLTSTDSCVEGPVGTLTFTRAVMNPGAYWYFQIVVKVNDDAALPSGTSVLVNTASVTSDGTESDSADNSETTYTIVNEEADLKIVKDIKPDGTIQAGDEAECTIIIDNLGPSTARNVTLIDEYLSDGTFEFGTITPGSCISTANPQVHSGTVTGHLGDLAAGGRITVKVRFSADESQDINNHASVSSLTPDPNHENNYDDDSVTFIELADLKIIKDIKPDDTIQAGDEAECTIIIDNLGPSTACNVTLIDEYLSDGTFEFGTITPGSCISTANPQVHSGTVTGNLGDLAAGGRITVKVHFSADESQDINNHARVSSLTLDPNPENNYDDDGVTFIALADLALNKTATPNPVIAGTNLTYDLSVTNNGPSTAVNVVIADVLPAGVTILSVSAPGGTCNAGIPGNADVPTTCTFDTMAKGAVKTMQIVVKVDPSFLGTLGNNARTFSDTYDPINDNNLATTFTTVNGSADLSVEKTDYPDPVLAGTVLTFDVKVTNNGPSTAVDVALTDVLPAWVTFQGYQVSNGEGTCSLLPGSTTDLSGDLNDLLPGQFVRVVFTVLVNPSTPHGTHLTNTATVSAATSDPNIANNTATTDTTVNAQADLKISKDATVLTSNPAPRVIYTITVLNNGPSDAQDVVVVDTLPLDPKKVIYVMDSSNGACTYSKTPSPHHVTWNIGTLKAGETRSVQIVVDIRGSVLVISNYANVTSATFDPILTDNTVRKDVRIKGGPGKK